MLSLNLLAFAAVSLALTAGNAAGGGGVVGTPQGNNLPWKRDNLQPVPLPPAGVDYKRALSAPVLSAPATPESPEKRADSSPFPSPQPQQLPLPPAGDDYKRALSAPATPESPEKRADSSPSPSPHPQQLPLPPAGDEYKRALSAPATPESSEKRADEDKFEPVIPTSPETKRQLRVPSRFIHAIAR